jgi:hypothetical protein
MMIDMNEFARRAKQIYDERYREQLEAEHMHSFCAIEPISGDYFLGRTMSEAGSAARAAYPDRLTHTVRVGHDAAIHIGAWSR